MKSTKLAIFQFVLQIVVVLLALVGLALIAYPFVADLIASIARQIKLKKNMEVTQMKTERIRHFLLILTLFLATILPTAIPMMHVSADEAVKTQKIIFHKLDMGKAGVISGDVENDGMKKEYLEHLKGEEGETEFKDEFLAGAEFAAYDISPFFEKVVDGTLKLTKGTGIITLVANEKVRLSAQDALDAINDFLRDANIFTNSSLVAKVNAVSPKLLTETVIARTANPTQADKDYEGAAMDLPVTSGVTGKPAVYSIFEVKTPTGADVSVAIALSLPVIPSSELGENPSYPDIHIYPKNMVLEIEKRIVDRIEDEWEDGYLESDRAYALGEKVIYKIKVPLGKLTATRYMTMSPTAGHEAYIYNSIIITDIPGTGLHFLKWVDLKAFNKLGEQYGGTDTFGEIISGDLSSMPGFGFDRPSNQTDSVLRFEQNKALWSGLYNINGIQRMVFLTSPDLAEINYPAVISTRKDLEDGYVIVTVLAEITREVNLDIHTGEDPFVENKARYEIVRALNRDRELFIMFNSGFDYTQADEFIEFDKKGLSNPVKVPIGGYRFMKNDEFDGGNLKGAQFKVLEVPVDEKTSNPPLYLLEDGFIKFIEVTEKVIVGEDEIEQTYYRPAIPADEEDENLKDEISITITSSENTGTIDIRGLSSKVEYQLVEVKAPKDYIMLNIPIDFSVFPTHTEDDKIIIGTIHNSDQLVEVKIDDNDLANDTYHNVFNRKHGSLPNTGSTGIRYLIAVALAAFALMLGVLLMKRKLQTDHENKNTEV